MSEIPFKDYAVEKLDGDSTPPEGSKPVFYDSAVEGSNKFMIVINDERKKVFFYPSAINRILESSDSVIPIEIKTKIRALNITQPQRIDRTGIEKILKGTPIGAIVIPDKLVDMPIYVKSVMNAVGLEKNERYQQIIMSVAFSSAIAIGQNFEAVFLKNITSMTLPIGQLLWLFGLENQGATAPENVINLALMTFCTIGKQVTDMNSAEFQKRRFNACIAERNVPMPEPAIIPTHIMATMNRFWPTYHGLITDIIRNLLITPPTTCTADELCILTQAKLVNQFAYMSVFSSAIQYMDDFLLDDWMRVPGIQKDMGFGFKKAVDFFFRSKEEERPYLRLLRPAGYECMEYKNFPSIYYASAIIPICAAGESTSYRNRIYNTDGLSQKDQVMIEVIAPIVIKKYGITAPRAEDLKRIKEDFVTAIKSAGGPALSLPPSTGEYIDIAAMEKDPEILRFQAILHAPKQQKLIRKDF